MAIPFTLIAWGEKHVDSGVAAIANSTVPIFVALLAIRFRPSERVTGMRLFGVLLGLVGVGVLTGLNPEGGWWAIAGHARGRRRLVLLCVRRTSTRRRASGPRSRSSWRRRRRSGE